MILTHSFTKSIAIKSFKVKIDLLEAVKSRAKVRSKTKVRQKVRA